jgi:tripartite-type tricarboxylate transporter receptor subunit TctC
MRRMLLAAGLAAGLVSSVVGGAWAQVQVVIPFPAGGGSDIIGRMLQPTFAEELGASVLIRNVSGAAGTLGASEVARAKPDGTTLLLTSMSVIAIQPSFRPSVPYRAASFAPVCLVADAPAVLMTPQNSGLRTLADVATRARAEPGKLPFATGGIGGMGHVSMTALARAMGIEMNHIPFRGSGDAVQAMQQGSVPMLTAEANLVRQYGLHPIAVFAEKRMPEYPDALTVREQGHDLVFALWTGLYAPAGTPEAVLARLDGACGRTLRTPSVVEGMTRVAHPIRYLGRQDFAAFTQAEAEKYRGIIEAAGMRQAD